MPNTTNRRLDRQSGLLTATAPGCWFGICGMHGNVEAGEASFKQLDAEQLAKLEETLQRRYAKLAPEVVRVISFWEVAPLKATRNGSSGSHTIE
jgi:hypothetical protein